MERQTPSREKLDVGWERERERERECDRVSGGGRVCVCESVCVCVCDEKGGYSVASSLKARVLICNLKDNRLHLTDCLCCRNPVKTEQGLMAHQTPCVNRMSTTSPRYSHSKTNASFSKKWLFRQKLLNENGLMAKDKVNKLCWPQSTNRCRLTLRISMHLPEECNCVKRNFLCHDWAWTGLPASYR